VVTDEPVRLLGQDEKSRVLIPALEQCLDLVVERKERREFQLWSLRSKRG
jgi:hypothetical protein